MDLASLFLVTTLAYGLPPKLLESVCYVESGHKVNAFNKHDGDGGSKGICQVKESTCKGLGIYGDIWNPKTNIDCAGAYLKRQINRFRSTKRGVCAYNRGKSTGNGDNRYTRRVFAEWKKRTRY